MSNRKHLIDLLAQMRLISPPLMAMVYGAIAKTSQYQQLAKALIVDVKTYSLLAEAVLGIYGKWQDFALLHVVTSLQALSVLLPLLEIENKVEALNSYWRALVAVSLTVQRTKSITQPAIKVISWEEIKKYACRSHDEHVIKLVYSSWREFQRSPNELYNLVAMRELQTKRIQIAISVAGSIKKRQARVF